MNAKPFKSPKHKLISFFQRSRDKWKERARRYFSQIRAFEVRVRDLDNGAEEDVAVDELGDWFDDWLDDDELGGHGHHHGNGNGNPLGGNGGGEA